MAVIEISRNEHGVIRVFAISRPIADVARDLTKQSKSALASALLGAPVSAENLEIFPISDLTGVGLPHYLSEGYAVDPAAIRSDAARLEALDGYVLLLFSKGGIDGDAVLKPTRDLTIIGTYAEPRPSHAAVPIATPSAKPYSGTNPEPGAPRRSRVGSAMTAIAALLILLLIWWILR